MAVVMAKDVCVRRGRERNKRALYAGVGFKRAVRSDTNGTRLWRESNGKHQSDKYSLPSSLPFTPLQGLASSAGGN